MDIDGTERSLDNAERLFGLPSAPPNNMNRSREALLLRLEQMKIGVQPISISEESEEEKPMSKLGSPSNKNKSKSKAIPIKKAVKSYSHNTHKEGRGVTDDMMFFAEGESQHSVDPNEPFIPPHLQHNDSFSTLSYM